MMTCRELADFIQGYLDGELSPRERRAFKLHLALCSACRAYLRTYKETIVLGKAAFEDPAAPVPSEVPEDLVQAILESRKKLWP